MAEKRTLSLISSDFGGVGQAIGALVDIRETEIVSLCRDLVEAAFSDSLGNLVLEVMLHSTGTMSLREIGQKCERGKRAILPDGKLRVVIERMVKEGVIVNHVTPDKPRYCLDRGDRRVQMLVRMYGPVRISE